jgi:hypothetical protein
MLNIILYAIGFEDWILVEIGGRNLLGCVLLGANAFIIFRLDSHFLFFSTGFHQATFNVSCCLCICCESFIDTKIGISKSLINILLCIFLVFSKKCCQSLLDILILHLGCKRVVIKIALIAILTIVLQDF